jgi:outer membrane protein assembly factor BamB
MTLQQFIDELESRGLLSDRVLSKLREKVAQSERPMSPNALAKFLVEKEHITRRQAADILDTLSQSGVNIDREMDKPPGDERVEDAAKVSTFAPLPADALEDDYGSSIFAPYLSGVENTAPNQLPSESAEELGLAPLDDVEAADTDIRVRPVRPVAKPQDEFLPTEQMASDILDRRTEPEHEASEPPEQVSVKKQSRSRKELADNDLEAALSEAPNRDTKKAKRSKSTKQKPASEWESPLLLVGGGVLALLVIGGAVIAWLLNWETGDEKLRLAQDAVNSGSYTQAIAHYQDFLENFPRHRERSLARVQLAMARLRKATEASNYAAALDIANDELEAIEDEEEFNEAHGELAALLPRIALGFAQEAEASTDLKGAQQSFDRSTAALALANNTKYVPKSLRDEAEIQSVQETLERVRRRQQAQSELQKALAAMDQAIASGDTRAAYAAHGQLVKQHPELAGDARVAETVQKITAAERQAIRFVSEEQPAETTERPVPWVAALAVANRRAPAAGGGQSGVACLRVEGAVYGLDAATGALLWRRPIGFASSVWPIPVANHVLVVDGRHHELLRLESATGKLLWRQTIGEPIAAPLIAGGRAFAAAESGRLHVIDLNSGARSGYIQFAQPLRVPPAVDRQNERLYLSGDHSSLYTISLADMSCLGVYYLGHSDGSIRVSPVPISDKLAVIENDGVETSRLRLLSLDNQRAVAKEIAARRLTGLAAAPPLAMGRRLFVASDRGQIEVYEVGAGEGGEPLAVVAVRNATGNQPIARHIAPAGRNIWIGDTQLTKYAIVPTGNRLPVESIEENFAGDAFDHPMIVLGETLLHIRRPKDRAGAAVAATNTSDGRVLWQTDLAIPPAGSPVVEPTRKSIAVANAEGHVFRFDEAAIRSRVQDQPLLASSMPANQPAFTAAVDAGQGRAAFCAPGSNQLLIYNPAQNSRPVQTVNLPSPLACDVTPLGDGIVVPLSIGQVLYLNAADGTPLATPFQPRLEPGNTLEYRPATPVDRAKREFLITDGRNKIYLVSHADQPQPHLAAIAEATVARQTIESPIVVLGNLAIALAGGSQLVRFTLPSLEAAGTADLPAPVEWGPYAAGDALLAATADDHLVLVSADGAVRWRVPIQHGPLIEKPLVMDGTVLLAYRKGIIERRALADGSALAAKDVEHPLAAGPVPFLQRLVVAAHDGTLLVVDQP